MRKKLKKIGKFEAKHCKKAKKSKFEIRSGHMSWRLQLINLNRMSYESASKTLQLFCFHFLKIPKILWSYGQKTEKIGHFEAKHCKKGQKVKS